MVLQAELAYQNDYLLRQEPMLTRFTVNKHTPTKRTKNAGKKPNPSTSAHPLQQQTSA